MGIFIILLHVHLDWHNSICYFHRRACAKSAQVNVRFWDTSDGFPFNLYKEMVCRKRPRITHHMLQHICLLYIWTKHFRLLWFIHSMRMCKSSVILYDPLLEIVWTHCDGISYTIAHYTHLKFSLQLSIANFFRMLQFWSRWIGIIIQKQIFAHIRLLKLLYHTGKSVSEALILKSVNPQYDERLFIEFPEKYRFRMCCVQILFWMSKQKQNNFCKQHVLYLYFLGNSKNKFRFVVFAVSLS